MSTSISQGVYVYTLACPESMGGAIFYVGKGKKNRIGMHETEARQGLQSTKCNIIREIWAAGEEVVKTKVAHFDNEYDAHIYEWGLMNMTTYAENLTNRNRGMGAYYKNDIKYRKAEDEIPCDLLGDCLNSQVKDIQDSETKTYTLEEVRTLFKISPRALERWCSNSGIVANIDPADSRRRYLTNEQFIYLSKKYRRICLTETEAILFKEIERLQKRIEKLERKA